MGEEGSGRRSWLLCILLIMIDLTLENALEIL